MAVSPDQGPNQIILHQRKVGIISTKLTRADLEKQGFSVVRSILSRSERRALISALGPVEKAGRRGLLALPAVASLARALKLIDLVRPHLPVEPFPVRALYFDKSPEANWLAPWHQDLKVRARVEVPGFGPWSLKEGIPHVQPPIELLQKMLTVRLHLDDAGASNGALRVLPGSHRQGRLSRDQIQEWRREQRAVLCRVSAGDALLMRPLLLHASAGPRATGIAASCISSMRVSPCPGGWNGSIRRSRVDA